MSTPHPHPPPEGLSAFAALLHHYATHNTRLPNPLDTHFDTESVHHRHPRTPNPDEATTSSTSHS